MSDIGRRAVACKAWRWMPGMRDQHGRIVLDVNAGRNDGVPVWWTDAIATDTVEMYDRPDDARPEWATEAPDLSDPATRGCVLARLREVYRDGSLTTRSRRSLRAHGDADSGLTDGPWDVVSTSEHVTISLHGTLADTEEESMVLALEAAPVLS